MLLRIALLGSMAAAIAGCSNAPTISGPSGLSNANLQPISTAVASEHLAIEDELKTNKTMASKVLTAIALERITGRKPHPARLSPQRNR